MDPLWQLQSRLLLAIKSNKVDQVRYFITECNVDVDLGFGLKEKPALYLAIESGHSEMLGCLLELGGSPNLPDLDGLTPLHIAVRDQRLDMMQILLRHRAQVNTCTRVGLLAPLHVAVGTQRLDVVKQLVHAGARIDVLDGQDCTPLLMAACHGASQIAEYLLGKGAGLRHWDRHGNCVGHFLNRLNFETVKLIVRKADFEGCLVWLLNAKNVRGLTPLHVLASCDLKRRVYSASLVEYFMLYIAKVDIAINAQDCQGRTPLMLAVQNEPKIVNMLLRFGADMSIADELGNSPFQHVCRLRDFKMMSELIAAGALLQPGVSVWVANQLHSQETRPDTLHFLQNLMAKLPYSLHFWCRHSLLQRYGSHLESSLKPVHLPGPILDFLLMKDNALSITGTD